MRGTGCRLTGRCRRDEPVWMRGNVTCGPVDEAECLGGRCCTYPHVVEQETPEPEPEPEPANAP
jgi:hypothetical protein